MMAYTLDQLVREARKLLPLPRTAQKALALARDPKTNAAGLVRALGTDQVLAARVLRWTRRTVAPMGLPSAQSCSQSSAV